MTRYLLADIGGTHSRLAEAAPGGSPVAMERFDNAEFSSAGELFARRAAQLAQHYPDEELVVGAAVAGPVEAGRARLTNRDWLIDAAELAQVTASRQAVVLNDYQVLARSLPELDRADLTLLSGQPAQRLASPIAVLGPGTGLGVGGALPTPWGWAVVSGEGGHVTLAAADDEEAQVLARLRDEIGHVSAEALLCGSGLERLHNLLHGERCTAAQISAASQGYDPAAAHTLDLFFRFLGITAGNLALTLGARGGIYLAGGILAKLGAERIMASRLHSRLIAKGRFTEYLKAVPVQLVDDPERAALVGVRAWLDDLWVGQRGRDPGDRRRG